MTTKTDRPKQEENGEFGLPQVEFKPIAARGRQWFKITAIIVGLVLTVGAGVVYWFFYYSPTKEIVAIHEKKENRISQSDADPMHKSTSSKLQNEAREKVKPFKLDKSSRVLEKREATKGPSAKDAVRSRTGTITKINIAQGYYYIVLGSFVDKDLASDYAHRLIQKGVGITLIAPPKGHYYSRVTIKQGKSFRDACEEAEVLKATYGPDIWVMKY